jgi:hypothetical protein
MGIYESRQSTIYIGTEKSFLVVTRSIPFSMDKKLGYPYDCVGHFLFKLSRIHINTFRANAPYKQSRSIGPVPPRQHRVILEEHKSTKHTHIYMYRYRYIFQL